MATKEIFVIDPVAVQDLEAYTTERINNTGWNDLSRVFDGNPRLRDTARRTANIENIADQWDSRNNAPRQGAPLNDYVEHKVNDPEHPKNAQLFERGIKRLGLSGTTTRESSGLWVIAGATADAMVMRGLHAQAGPKAYLGNDRPLGDDEKTRMRIYFPDSGDAQTEADFLHELLKYQYPERELVHADRRFAAYNTEDGLVYWANAEPQFELPLIPGDIQDRTRANTADTFLFFKKQLGADLPNDITVSTNDIYAPFQGMDAKHIFGAAVANTVGFTPQEGARLVNEESGFNLPTPFRPKDRQASAYTQEARSEVRSWARARKTIAHSKLVLSLTA